MKHSNKTSLWQINQTGTYGRGGRTNIAVPAQGIVDIRNALSEVLEEYGSEEGWHEQCANIQLFVIKLSSLLLQD